MLAPQPPHHHHGKPPAPYGAPTEALFAVRDTGLLQQICQKLPFQNQRA